MDAIKQKSERFRKIIADFSRNHMIKSKHSVFDVRMNSISNLKLKCIQIMFIGY